jgi:hypothetical protein
MGTVDRAHAHQPWLASAAMTGQATEEDPMGRSRAAKKIDKFEKKADQVRKKAEKKGKELQGKASDRIDDLSGQDDKGGKKGVLALLLALAAGGLFALKKKRDQELDEALWEEPRSI